MEKIKDIINANLINLRRSGNYTQKDIADAMKISISAYSKIENGHTDVNFSRLLQLTTFFDVCISELLSPNFKRPEIADIQSKLDSSEDGNLVYVIELQQKIITSLEKQLAFFKQ
jgi:transcriptional regulator with XRE-family HTH domain